MSNMVKQPGLSISLVRWMVLAFCVCGLSAHLLIDSLGLPLSQGSAGPVAVQAAAACLEQGDPHHDHFYQLAWQPAVQPASEIFLAPLQTVIHCLCSSSPLLPPPKTNTAA
jgi:hypothetical protein